MAPEARRPAPPALPVAPASEPISVRQFGKYVLVRKLAEGGMAEIFLAKQVGAEGFERNVVVKRMLKHLSGVTDFVGMFLDEARLAARLAHQNIVQIYDLGAADGCYFICMEYLAGEDFSTVLRTAGRRREYVPLNVTVRVIIDAAMGLHFAHEFADEEGKPLKLVHRDISPSNVFVTYQGQVKLLDFGIAKAESRVTNTTAGVVKGKYMYMAPEQARGIGVDRRADIFSLGVSLYEALTNVRPFAHDSDLAILNAVLKGQFTPPRKLRAEIPPELEAVVLKAMATNVEERYQTSAQFAGDLEAFAAGNTSSSGGTQVAMYMRESFGEKRITEKTRIPSLSSLAASGVDVPGFANPLSPRTDPETTVPPLKPKTPAGQLAQAQGETGTMVVQTTAGRSKGLLVAAAVTVGLAGAGFGAYQAFLKPVPPPAPPPERVAKVVDERPDDAPVLVPAQAIDAGLAAAVDTRPPPPPPPPKEPRLVQLSIGDITKVVGKAYGGIAKCFSEHKDDLPSTKGQAKVTFTIVGSGKVTAASSDMSEKPVGRCLEVQVKALKFPANKDKEISLTLPFAYNTQ